MYNTKRLIFRSEIFKAMASYIIYLRVACYALGHTIHNMKKTFAREIITFFIAIIATLAISGLTKAFQSFKQKSLTSKINRLNTELDSLNKVDLNRKVLFYFCEVENETFLDRLYKDYKTTVLKKVPDFPSLIDTLRQYNGILFASFDFILLDKSQKQYYLDNLKYPEFEKEVKNSISIYDKKLPDAIIADIKEKELSQDMDTSYVERFWTKATKNPEETFAKMSDTYKKYYGFTTSNDFIAYIKLYNNTSYRNIILQTKIQINENAKDKIFWDKLTFFKIITYVAIVIFGLLYFVRGLWYLVRWALKNK